MLYNVVYNKVVHHFVNILSDAVLFWNAWVAQMRQSDGLITYPFILMQIYADNQTLVDSVNIRHVRLCYWSFCLVQNNGYSLIHTNKIVRTFFRLFIKLKWTERRTITLRRVLLRVRHSTWTTHLLLDCLALAHCKQPNIYVELCENMWKSQVITLR